MRRNQKGFRLAALGLAAVLLAGCGSSGQPSGGAGETASQTAEETPAVTDQSAAGEQTDPVAETGEETGEADAESDVIPALRDTVGEAMGCRIGCAVTGNELKDDGVWEILTTHFNAVTFGNELKPDALVGYSVGTCPGTTVTELNGEEITVPVLTYSTVEGMLDRILEWNQANPDREIKVRGHVLVWHSQTPEWFFHEDYDKKKPYVDATEMDKRLEWYIREVLTHFTGEDSKYKDLFYGWDVVNEAVSDSGGFRTDAENAGESLDEDRHGSNSSWWHIYQSEQYIINAFKYANKYAPESLELYYNDYNECVTQKRSTITKLLTEIKEQEGAPGEGTRISAMGMQGHYGMDSPTMDSVNASAKAYGRVVGNVQITEWDVSASSDYDGSADSLQAEYEKQAQKYNLWYFALHSAMESGDVNVTGLTFWGTIDPYSWLQSRSNIGGGNKTGLPQCPLLFDGDYQPKPAFWVFTKTEWR
jgi:endo-1,4-beta-xylanase